MHSHDLFATASPPSSQHGFDGFGAARATDRLFFAVFPDAMTASGIAALATGLRRQHALHGQPLHVDRLHVTLHHLGDYAGLPADVLAAANAAAGSVDAGAFDAAFDSAASFPARGRAAPFVLLGGEALAPLHAFQRQLGERMAACGLARLVERRFTPHVTLLYDRRNVALQDVPPITWRVREFVLVHSLLGRTEHRVLGRWVLRDER